MHLRKERQAEERLATTSELNLAPSLVTDCPEGSILITFRRREDENPTEFEAVAHYQKDSLEIRDVQSVLRKGVYNGRWL